MKKASYSALASRVCHVFVTYSHEVVTHLYGSVKKVAFFAFASRVLNIENVICIENDICIENVI